MNYSVRGNLKPYNEIWLDCIQNNLMSILISYDSIFELLPATMKFEYWKKKKSQQFDSRDTYKSLLKQGLFIPKIIYQTDQIKSFFNIEKRIFQNSKINGIHELICDAFSENKFVFLHVDRFFFSSGRETGKLHFVHPTFLYGYSEEQGTYTAIEDCLSPGHMQSYQIPKEVVTESTKFLLQQGRQVCFSEVTPLENKIKNNDFGNYDLMLEEIKDTISLSEIRYVKEYDLYYQVGLSVLDQYLEEYEEIIGSCEDVSIFSLRTTSFVQNHKKNGHMLLKRMQDKPKYRDTGLIKFAERSLELALEWEIFKNVMIKNMVSGSDKNDRKSKEKLRTIIDLEYKLFQGI